MLGALQLAAIGLLIAVAIWLWSRTLWQQSGLPKGRIIYTDSETWFPNRETLAVPDLQLVGKPDYLVEQANGELIPVELKSAFAPVEPRAGHILQLAAYCLLVAENYEKRPSYGIIQYRDRAFAIDYSEALERELLQLLTNMRDDLYDIDLPRNHDKRRRCLKCSVRHDCTDRLI